MADLPDYFAPDSLLARHWQQPLCDFAAPPAPAIEPVEAERHAIHAGLLMAIVAAWWNGNLRGSRDSDYPSRVHQRRADGTYLGDRLGDRYLGHNIAALAVDRTGRVRDVDFNHNTIYASTVQHAEARLIRRLFDIDALDQSRRPRDEDVHVARTRLDGVTIFTSLESCAQCSGIMALSCLPKVFYLQPDPSQYLVAQLMHRLSDAPAAQHVPASAFGFPAFDQLKAAYAHFQRELAEGGYFWRSTTDPQRIAREPEITAFLCTDAARDIYQQAADDFQRMSCRFPHARPGADMAPASAAAAQDVLTNQEVLEDARQFLAYAATAARRGTPHFN